jgi:hypothetical protein
VLHALLLRSAPSQSSSGSATLLPQVDAAGVSSDPQLAMQAVMQSERKVPSLKLLLIVA